MKQEKWERSAFIEVRKARSLLKTLSGIQVEQLNWPDQKLKAPDVANFRIVVWYPLLKAKVDEKIGDADWKKL